jgi:hypothetical protein
MRKEILCALVSTLSLTALVFSSMPGSALAAEGITDDKCILCHVDNSSPDQSSTHVDTEVLAKSVHSELTCMQCHEEAAENGWVDDRMPPHSEELSPVNCTMCHYKGNSRGAPDFSPMQQYRTSVHGRASLERGDVDVATCSACHGQHDIRAASDPESTIYHTNIPSTCASCHEDGQLTGKHNIHVGHPYNDYIQGVHGRGLSQDGPSSMAAVCTDCHGVHDIQAYGEVDLKPHKPSTCGVCHRDAYKIYIESAHGRAAEEGIADAPVCTDCHGEHKIVAPWNPEANVSPLHVNRICAHCHDDVNKMNRNDVSTNRVFTYQQGSHGMGISLGVVSITTCVTCHGHHDILSADAPGSSINEDNLAKTCGSRQCHPDASAAILGARIHDDSLSSIQKPAFEILNPIGTTALYLLGTIACIGLAVWLYILASRRIRRILRKFR